jgi:anaerobic magnesium-protoporphyrin IX monomethyl ester cyclase
MNKKVLLINSDYFKEVYGKSKQKGVLSRGIPILGLACIAAPLVKSGHDITILDLNLYDNPKEILIRKLNELRPDVIGLTATTAIVHKIIDIAKVAKEILPHVTIVAGGPHSTAVPEDLLKNSGIDIVVLGEGDKIFQSIVESENMKDIPNIYYKDNGKIVHSNILNESINDLDLLQFPAYFLYDIHKYIMPKIFARKSPIAFMETSRGCYSHCVYCNKNIHGYKLRQKSPERVVDEMEYILNLGFKEIQIIDDVFTADMKRAYTICEEILKRGLKFPWYPRGGIRVDRVSMELFSIMKKAGCYRIPFGIESGSQRVIDVIKKRITLEQAENAVRFSKEAGFEVECYFMIGLPTETEDDILKSIDFAKKLDPNYVKFSIAIPLPGTEMFDEMMKNNRIKSLRWSDYNFAITPSVLYEHDNLSWEQLEYYYAKCHRDFYLRPRYIAKSFYNSVKNGLLLANINAFLKTKWF